MTPPTMPPARLWRAALPLVFAAFATAPLTAAPVINEIHYNNDVNTVINEFVEIYNPDPGPVDLSSWRLTGGVEFTFPNPTTIDSGAFLVIAANPSTILSRYGITALGPYVGGLSGKGEKIELVDEGGLQVDRVDYAVQFPWPTAADGAGSSMELIHPSLDNDLGGSWRSSSTAPGVLAPPTPGVVNSVASEVAPPQIRQVKHSPQQPNSSEQVVVTAKVTDPQGVKSVKLEYRLVTPGNYVPAFQAKSRSALLANPTSPRNPNPAYETGWVTVNMLDDGNGSDAVAGDDTYTVDLPARAHRTLVRYRIRITDNADEAITVPYADDESLNFAYFVYNGIPDYRATTRSVAGSTPHTHPTSTLETLPAYHLLTTTADYDQCVNYDGNNTIPSGNFAARSEFNWSGTFVYNGKVYDNIKYRLRQRNARYQGDGKRSFRFRFNRGNYVQFHDLWGNPYPTKWRTLNTHKMSTRPPSGEPSATSVGLYEAINSILWNVTGTPAPFAHWLHFRVIKQSGEATNQYDGDFYGLLLGMEDYDSRFLDAHDLEDGNLYKLKSYILEGTEIQRYQAPTAITGGIDYENIINNLRPERPASWINRVVDLDAWYRYHAIVDAVRHYDVAPNTGEHLKNRAYYFAPDGNNRYGKLNVLPWDSDTSWGPNWNGGEDFVKFSLYDPSARPDRANLQLEYRNVVREIRDLLWQEDQIHDLIDLLEDKIAPFHLADRDRWTNAPASAGYQTDGPLSAVSTDMKRFAFIGRKTWVGGGGGDLISHDTTNPGMWNGRDQYLDELAKDTLIPATPTLTDLSPPEHAADLLRFESSAFSDNSGTFAAMEYRIAEVVPYTGDGMPFPLEWTATWESGELDTFTAQIVPPASAVRGGRSYRARVRHKDSTGRWSHWSAPVEFTATNPSPGVLLQFLVISEIMYNPLGSDDLEYVELTNIGDIPLDLTNVRFTKGIDFDFAPGTMLDPGDYLLVVKNIAAFEAQYGPGKPIAGEYQFEAENSLSNEGERLKLAIGALGIHDFEYGTQSPWPEAADGAGYSLVLMRTSDNAAADPLDPLGHGIASNWRLSATMWGAPGSSGTQSFVGLDPNADNDHDDLSAFLEHAIGTDDNDGTSGPGLFSTAIEDGCLTFSFPRNLAADDVSYQVEISFDLQGWIPSATWLRETPNGDGTSTVTYKLDAPAQKFEHFFMRLRVTHTDPLP